MRRFTSEPQPAWHRDLRSALHFLRRAEDDLRQAGRYQPPATSPDPSLHGQADPAVWRRSARRHLANAARDIQEAARLGARPAEIARWLAERGVTLPCAVEEVVADAGALSRPHLETPGAPAAI